MTSVLKSSSFTLEELATSVYGLADPTGYCQARGGTLRISGCGCAARTLEPLAYTRASFSWILPPYTRVNSWFPWSSQPTGQFREK